MSYDGATFTWAMGRQLAGYSKGATAIGYKYNQDGIRTEKTVNGTVTTYNVLNGNVISEQTGGAKVYYRYDGGRPIAINVGGAEYYYVYNTQGDVIALTDTSGAVVAEYAYDAWGNPTGIKDGAGNDVSNNVAHIANVNPYRYRGYRWDSEIQMYYLMSRYYSPEWGRFVNFDDVTIIQENSSKLLSGNGFAYGNNHPVMMIDPTGHAPKAIIKNIPRRTVKRWRDTIDFLELSEVGATLLVEIAAITTFNPIIVYYAFLWHGFNLTARELQKLPSQKKKVVVEKKWEVEEKQGWATQGNGNKYFLGARVQRRRLVTKTKGKGIKKGPWQLPDKSDHTYKMWHSLSYLKNRAIQMINLKARTPRGDDIAYHGRDSRCFTIFQKI